MFHFAGSLHAVAAYRSVSGGGCLWVFLVLGGIAVGVGLGAYLHQYDKVLGAWVLVPITLPMVLGVAAAVVLSNRFTNQRIEGVRELLQTEGFYFERDLSPELRTELYEPLEHLTSWAGLLGGETMLKWVAHSMGRRFFIFEHEYTTGSGKSTQSHPHTALCWRSDLGTPRAVRLGAGAGFAVIRPRVGERRSLTAGATALATGDGNFDRKCLTFGDSAHALSFLTADVVSKLADSPKGERWFFGAGWVCCLYTGHFDATNLANFMRHAAEVLE